MNHTLADRYQAAKAVAAKADAEVKALHAELLALGQPVVEGQRCTIKIADAPKDSLTKEMLVGEFGLDWYKARAKTIEGKRVTIIAKAMQTLVVKALEEIAAA
jgi:hypothetical protein